METEQLRRLQKLAASGDPTAQYQLGVQLLFAGRTTVGFRYLQSAADAGQPAAMFELAQAALAGDLTGFRDERIAVEWTLSSAEAGHPDAQFNLGVWYEDGLITGSPAVRTAIGWYTRAAEQGSRWALERLVSLYWWGSPYFKRNPMQAYRWARRLHAVQPNGLTRKILQAARLNGERDSA